MVSLSRSAAQVSTMLACKKEEYETMNPKIVIRNETPDDVCAITEVTIAAFALVFTLGF